MDMQFSSTLFGNLTTNFEPALSSLSLSGRKRQTTLMLSSAGISRSADISIFKHFLYIIHLHTFVQNGCNIECNSIKLSVFLIAFRHIHNDACRYINFDVQCRNVRCEYMHTDAIKIEHSKQI